MTIKFFSWAEWAALKRIFFFLYFQQKKYKNINFNLTVKFPIKKF